MPLLTNECKVVNQNEKESNLKEFKEKENSARKSTSFDTNEVADKNEVTVLDKEKKNESKKKIQDEKASKSIESFKQHISVENVTKGETSNEERFEKIPNEVAKEVNYNQLSKVPDSSSELVLETVTNKKVEKIESSNISPTYASSKKHITVKDEAVTEETIAKPQSIQPDPTKCTIRNVENSVILQKQVSEAYINEMEDKIAPLDDNADAKVSQEYDTNLIAEKSNLVSLDMESVSIPGHKLDEERRASSNIEACKVAIEIEKNVEVEGHEESQPKEKPNKKKAVRKNSACLMNTANQKEVSVVENLSNIPSDSIKVANAHEESESSKPCVEIQESTAIIDTTEHMQEDIDTKSNATASIEPNTGTISVDKVMGSEITKNVDAHKIPSKKIANKKESASVRSSAVENKVTTIQNTSKANVQTVPSVVPQKQKIDEPNLSIQVEDKKELIETNTAKKLEKSQLPSAESLQDISQIPDLDLDSSETVSLLNEDFIKKIKAATKMLVSNFRKGVIISDVTKYLGEEHINVLKKPESQIALMNVAQRIGNAATIHQTIVTEMSMNNENTETFGSRALLIALESSASKITPEDAVIFFQPKDFDCSKIKSSLCHIINEAHAIESHEPQECFLTKFEC